MSWELILGWNRWYFFNWCVFIAVSDWTNTRVWRLGVWILFVKIWVNGLWAETHFITINPESVKEMGKALYLAGNCHLKLKGKNRGLWTKASFPLPVCLPSNQRHYINHLYFRNTVERLTANSAKDFVCSVFFEWHFMLLYQLLAWYSGW